MEHNNREQYTFDENEKETLEKLNTVEASINQKLQEKNERELIATKYYSELVINTKRGPVTLTDVFITIEKDNNNQLSYHFNWIKENDKGEQVVEEGFSVDKDGKVVGSEELFEYLDGELDIEKVFELNDMEKGRLKGISEKQEIDEQKQKDGEKNDDQVQDIEENLNEESQELGLSNIRKIKDPYVAERMPDVFGDSNEHAQAYSRKLGKFVMLEKNEADSGKWQINDKVQPSKTTLRTIIVVDENGENVERKVPTALMKTNRSDKEIAVTYGQYGEINIQTVDVLPCQERVAREVREQGETGAFQESAQIRNEFKAGGKEYTHNLAHQVEDIEQAQKEANQTVDNEISEDDYIPNTGITWKEFMDETGESLPTLIERYNKEMNETGNESDSKNVVQDIIDDYDMISHERTH